jgi:hypothetical protein
MEQPVISNTKPAPANNTWLYILGGCCCLIVIIAIIVGIFGSYFLIATQSFFVDELQPLETDTTDEYTDYDYTDYDYPEIKDTTDTQTDVTGIIEGSLSYPDESIPSDMKVCAENIFYSDEIYCADQLINDPKYTNSTGYNITAPVGSYYVYSYLPSAPDQKAYYTEFVECGLSVDCTSHDELIIDVYPNETTDKVDPIDWYNQ